MIGRKCKFIESDGTTWVGRVVACQLSPRVVTPDTDREYPQIVAERWQVLVEDEDGQLWTPSRRHGHKIRLLPPGDPTPLGFINAGGEE